MKNIKTIIFGMLLFSILIPKGISALTLNEVNPTLESNFSIENIYEEIKSDLISDYSNLYDLDDFYYDFNERTIDGKNYIDINIYTEMTLTRNPNESPFILGMLEALKDETDEINRECIQKEIDFYLKDMEQYYNTPNPSTFTYTIALNDLKPSKGSKSALPSYSVFYRNDVSDDVILIPEENLSDVENPVEEKAQGIIAAQESTIIQEQPVRKSKAYIVYDRLRARDWALNNAYSAPEYPSSSVPGTDCANFVSKAISYGGIPQDKTGKWFQASTWGGWPGDNWFRTGYTPSSGGVVPYMTSKGYFYKEANKSKVFAGSIMFWNSTSHVALVTYGDGVTIKYTQHGAQQTKDTVYRTENASFYLPNASIMK